jgi:pyruvate dehydrogenase E1 component alpha subunit
MVTDTEQDSGPVAKEAAQGHLTLDDRVALLRYMLLMRGVEGRALTLYRQGRVPGSFYDGYGQEAVSAGSAFALAPQDAMCPLHRDLAAHMIRGISIERILGQYMGRAGGVTDGHEGNVHFGDHRLGIIGMVSMLPDMMPVANGLALAFKMRGEQRVALTYVGDGSSAGDFHEALNWAAVAHLPVIYIYENNQFAYSTPLDLQFAVSPLARAEAYGVASERVDGNDVEAMFEATLRARARALAGEGPTMIEAVTMRMHGHAAHDDMRYVPPEMVEYWRERDPIERQEQALAAEGVDIEAVRASVTEEIEQATALALELPPADPSHLRAAFAEEDPEVLGHGTAPWSGFANEGGGTDA